MIQFLRRLARHVPAKSLKYTSIYTDSSGISHFREAEIEMTATVIGPRIPPLGASVPFPARSCYFLTFPPGIRMDWHPAPGRLFHFFLAGGCEVTVSDGETRTFSQGDVVLAEDTTGKGHQTSNLGAVETLMAVVAISG
jgi:hypothetical protein